VIQQMPQMSQVPLVPQVLTVSSIPVDNSNSLGGKHDPLPCTINSFGFGADHDPKLLKAIAEAGNGIYYFIKGTENIPEAFADCLGGLLSVAAQNISLKFEVDTSSDVSIKKIFTKFKLNEITPKKSYELTMGDIQSDESREIIVMAQLPACSETTSFNIAKLSLSYFNVLTSQLDTASIDVTVSRPQSVPSDQTVNFELDKHRNRLSAAEAMEQATDAGNSGNLEKGRGIIQACMDQIQKSVSCSDPFCKGLLVDLKACLDTLRDRHVYQQSGAQMMMNNANAHFVQRSSNVQYAAQQAYQTPQRQEMQMNFKMH